MPNITELEKICTQIRRDILRMVHASNSGHPGGSLGCTEFFVSLYFEIMNHNKKFSMNGVGEDLFFLSNAMCIKLNNKLLRPNIRPINKCRKVNIRKSNLHFQIDNFISE